MNAKILLVGLTALPLVATADGFDYSFIEGGYFSSELDDSDVDGDGFGIKGSFALTDTLHFFADYTTRDFKRVDMSQYDLGLGAHWGLQQNLDFVGELGYVKAEVEVDTPFGSFEADEDGFGVGAGLRFRAGRKVELDGMIKYVNLDDSDTSLSLGGRYYFSPGFALVGGFLVDDDINEWNLGARFEFGKR
jgi:opacity protein-like surface antigen